MTYDAPPCGACKDNMKKILNILLNFELTVTKRQCVAVHRFDLWSTVWLWVREPLDLSIPAADVPERALQEQKFM